MALQPILAALKRHRLVTALLVLQVALTLAVGCNAAFIAQQHIAHLSRPTGIDEANLAVLHVQWLNQRGTQQRDAAMRADLARLRGLPNVVDAYADYSYPAAGPMAMLLQIGLQPAQAHPTSLAEAYFADTHALDTLGLELIAGRNFTATEVVPLAASATPAPRAIIITRALARALFPEGGAAGRTVFVNGHPSTIIGVVAHLQVPAVNTNSFAFRSVLMPYRLVDPAGTFYMVRARPDRLAAVIRDAPRMLLDADRMRVIHAARYLDLRAEAYARDRGIATLMCLIAAILLAATGAGTIGLATSWVEQRRKQIGIRRALGATRRDIRVYFQTENFLIVGGGIVLGSLLAFALHGALMHWFELPRLPFAHVAAGALALWCLGQVAVLGPALRASRIPPMVATRTL